MPELVKSKWLVRGDCDKRYVCIHLQHNWWPIAPQNIRTRKYTAKCAIFSWWFTPLYFRGRLETNSNQSQLKRIAKPGYQCKVLWGHGLGSQLGSCIGWKVVSRTQVYEYYRSRGSKIRPRRPNYRHNRVSMRPLSLSQLEHAETENRTVQNRKSQNMRLEVRRTQAS